MGGPVKPEDETGGVGDVSRVASRIHQLEERGLTQFKRMIKNLLAGSVLCVADAAHSSSSPSSTRRRCNLLLLLRALQPLQALSSLLHIICSRMRPASIKQTEKRMVEAKYT